MAPGHTHGGSDQPDVLTPLPVAETKDHQYRYCPPNIYKLQREGTTVVTAAHRCALQGKSTTRSYHTCVGVREGARERSLLPPSQVQTPRMSD